MGRNGGTRLELTWIGKNDRPRLEPRILIEDAEKSCHALTKRDGDIFDNMLIQGDNLLALKALEADFAGKVKCVFIDPPYNTGSAFEHYDDGVEHSLWLSLMRDRLDMIRRLLAEDGSLWITIDDNEAHYLKVLADEIFGRNNFLATVIWQKLHARNNSAQYFSTDHDFVLVYAKNKSCWSRNKVSRTAESDAEFWNPDNDPRGDWRRSDLTAAKPYSDGKFEVVGPHGDVFSPRGNRWWGISRDTFEQLVADKRIWWGATGRTFPFRKRFRSELGDLVPTTFWSHEDVGNNREAKQESAAIFGRDAIFSTPKPERLLERIIHISTNPGDLVLDSFAGSGTTGAVAHKMGRRWIMAELGDHAVTHIVPRLKKVVDGEDKGGVTEAAGWQGGGGFRFFRLAPSLLEKDKWGNWVIAKTYNAAMLAEAMCRHMGFTYQPSQDVAEYWRHGHSSERDFIFVTTASLTHDQLKAISHDVGPERTLLICCKAFNARLDDFENLTVKKIPHAILSRCEWGRDDYSLEIAELPTRETDSDNGDRSAPNGRKRGRGKATDIQPTLFGEGEA
jgi:adenine-specific DNA-methyltransferase